MLGHGKRILLLVEVQLGVSLVHRVHARGILKTNKKNILDLRWVGNLFEQIGSRVEASIEVEGN